MRNFLSLLLILILTGNINVLNAQAPLEWAASIGGPGRETGHSVVTDNAGNVYTVGSFIGKADFDPSDDPADTFFMTGAAAGNIFVSKLDAAGNFIWAKRMGRAVGVGSFTGDAALGVDVDNWGNVYLTGYFSNKSDFNPSEDPADTFFLTPQQTGIGLQAKRDIFVAKLDSAGNFIWARQFAGTFFGGIEQDAGRAIVVEKHTGNVYTTGNYDTKVDFDPGTGPADTFFLYTAGNFSEDVFVSKLDSAGNFVWAKRIGRAELSMAQQGRGITLDPSGNVLVTGYYNGKVDFNPSEAPADTFFMTPPGSGSDIFVLKLDNAGGFIWAKSMGSDNGSGDVGNAIVTDAAGNVYTTGYFSGTGADFDPGTSQHIINAIHYLDIFVSKLDSVGNFVWAKHMGGNGPNGEEGRAIALNSIGDVIVGGRFNGTVDFNIGGTPQTATNTATMSHVFIVKLNSAGDFGWVRTAGDPVSTSLHSDIWGATVSHSGDIYVTGMYSNTVDFDPPSGPTYTATNGDVFVLKLACADTSSAALEVTTCEDSYTLNDETYTQSGIYIQKLPNAFGCDSTIRLDLNISLVPQPVISVNEFILSTNGSYSTYQWYLNGNIIEGATDSIYIVTENGNYTVEVTNEDGCTSMSEVYPVTNVPVSIGDVSIIAEQINVYPNPSTDIVYIQAPVKVNIILLGMEGRVIKQLNDARSFSVKDLPDGIYVLQIKGDTGNLYRTVKFIKSGS